MFATLKNKLDLIFAKSWYFLRPKNKLGLVSFVILSSLFVTGWFVFTPMAHAGIGDWVIGVFSDIFFAIAGFFIKLTFWVLKFVIEIAGYNGYIDSPAVTVGWVMIRDMTNMIFIVVLLIISFGTILGLEHYEWKKMLVKVIMAAVVVNFSRIICGVIIDIGQVVMLTFVNGIAATASGNLVNMFNVQDIFKLNGGSGAGDGTPPSIFLASVAALVFSTMMLVTMGTFLLLLMARMAMLWVLIVMSPFAFVLNVLPQTEKYASQWWGEFGGNVIAGPVIVFFLWLSFVTVGSGGVHDDIKKYNALPSSSLIGSEASAPKEEQTGITNIMSWEKMANFVIAIAMLLAGAKMASELGAAGGEMMGKAKDIGKKVAMYASGYQAARWGAGKAVSGAKAAGKFVAMKVPFVGGDEWVRRGRRIKAAASKWYSKKYVEPRLIQAGKNIDTAYAENEDGTKKYGWRKRWGARMALWAAPAAFKEEYTKDAESGAKYAHEQLEHLVSTSKTPIGKFKTEAEADLHQLEETGSKIKAEKMAKVKEKRYARMDQVVADLKRSGMDKAVALKQIEESGEFSERELFDYKRRTRSVEAKENADLIEHTLHEEEEEGRLKQKAKLLKSDKGKALEERGVEAKAVSSQIEAELNSEKQIEELEAIKHLLKKDQEEGGGITTKATAAKAMAEQMKFDIDELQALQLARARDKELISQDRFSEANNEQNTINDQIESRIKKHTAGGDYVQSEAKTKAQIGRIASQEVELTRARAIGDGSLISIEQKKLEILKKSLAEMQISNLGTHAAVADGIKGQILDAAGMSREQSMEIDVGPIRQLQAQDLAELINEHVGATQPELDAAVLKLQQRFGEKANAILEQKRLRNEKAAGEGSLGRAGLYKVVDRGDGTLQTVIIDASIALDRDHVVSRRTSGLSGSKITNVKGFRGSLDLNAGGSPSLESAEAQKILLNLAGGLTGNNLGNVDEYTKVDLAEAFNNTSEDRLDEVLVALDDAVTDKRALQGLLNYALQTKKITNDAQRQAVQNYRDDLERSTRPGPRPPRP